MPNVEVSTVRTSVAGAILSLCGKDIPTELRAAGPVVSVTTLAGEGMPIVLRGDLTALSAVSRTALLGAPDGFPIGAFSHVLEEDFFEGYILGGDYQISATDNDLAQRGAYLAIGELFTYVNEGRIANPSTILEHYTRTLSYALTRSSLLWGEKRSEGIFVRWTALREIFGWAPSSSLPPKAAWSLVKKWLFDAENIPWIAAIRSFSQEKDLFPKVAELISNELGLALAPPPSSFDRRFEWLSLVAARLRAVEDNRSGRGSLALGLLLASIEPGELMHLNWIRPYLKHFPDVALHYAGWSSRLATDLGRRMNVLRGLSRKLARDLQRPLDFRLNPIEAASLVDLLGSNEPLDDISLRTNPRSFSVSLVPGVIVSGGYSLPDVPATVSVKRTEPDKANVDVAQSDLFANESDEDIPRILLREMISLRSELALVRAAVAKTSKKKNT